MTRTQALFSKVLSLQVEGDSHTAARLMDRLNPMTPTEAHEFLFQILGEGNKDKIDLFVNSAMVGLAQDMMAERDEEDAEDRRHIVIVAKWLGRNN